LGDLYMDGKFMKKDPEEAFKWYMMSALVGNSRSQYQVASMLDSGIGTEKDVEQAKKWFGIYSNSILNDSRKSAMETLKARKGDFDVSNDLLKAMSRTYQPQSMTRLATKYEQGKGFKKSLKGAFDLQSKAALAGGGPRVRLADMIVEHSETKENT